jgi:hypothetical protein
MVIEVSKRNGGREAYMKLCGRCGQVKQIDEFHKNGTKLDGRQAYCRKCNAENVNEKRLRNRQWINEYLSNNSCIDCGFSVVCALDFDHVRGEKKFTIARMKETSYSIARLQEEIDKCEVRCANCHRIRHYG